jgi:tRNA A-37 threonylcarbamoyl transferase component Bud32
MKEKLSDDSHRIITVHRSDNNRLVHIDTSMVTVKKVAPASSEYTKIKVEKGLDKWMKEGDFETSRLMHDIVGGLERRGLSPHAVLGHSVGVKAAKSKGERGESKEEDKLKDGLSLLTCTSVPKIDRSPLKKVAFVRSRDEMEDNPVPYRAEMGIRSDHGGFRKKSPNKVQRDDGDVKRLSYDGLDFYLNEECKEASDGGSDNYYDGGRNHGKSEGDQDDEDEDDIQGESDEAEDDEEEESADTSEDSEGDSEGDTSEDSEGDSEDEDDEETSSHSDDEVEEEEEEEEEVVELKVSIAKENVVRGFSLTKRGAVRRMLHLLQSDYGTKPLLTYRDDDGDDIAVEKQRDLDFVIKCHEQSTITKSNKLRLVAHFRPKDAPAVTEQSRSSAADDTMHHESPGNHSSEIAAQTDVLWQRGEAIGAGSFGEVFSGIDLRTAQRIAIKEVMLGRSTRQKNQARALQAELKILSDLTHPNIIKYLGAECTKDRLRIFLEYASEGSVRQALQKFGAFPEPLIRRYTIDILNGLSFLHAKGYIHRDIKPSNLLIDKDVVKLADFGCSTSLASDAGDFDASMTNLHGTVAGTTIYMSPEVMHGGTDEPDQGSVNQDVNMKRTKGYGRKADIWSLGVSLVEMSTAEPPFRNPPAAIYAVCVSKQFPSFADHMSSEAQSFLSR